MPAVQRRVAIGATVLRIAAASVFVAHGAARTAHGTVGAFGGFLDSWGFPAGTLVAGAITAVEIAGGLALAVGWLVVPLAGWFAMQIAAGIVMVHAQHGWFVVGHGQNGVEYSALIIAALAAVMLTDSAARRLGPRRCAG